MTIELAQTLSLVCYVLAVMFFILAITLFFIFHIPKIIGEISGVTAKRAIENIQQENAQTGDSKFISLRKTVNNTGQMTTGSLPIANKKKIKATISGMEQPQPVKMVSITGMDGNTGEMDTTTKLQTNVGQPVQTQASNAGYGSDDTTILNAPIPPQIGETTVLGSTPKFGETTVLSQAMYTETDYIFDVKVEISFAESQEIIE